jgi:protein TonB
MIVCGGGVLWLVATMNEPVPPAEQPKGPSGVAMSVAPPPPPKQRQEPPPRPQKQPPKDRPAKPAPPTPMLGAQLRGLDLGLGGPVGTGGLDAAKGKLLETGAAKSLVMTEESVDEPPRPISRRAPEYPPRARRGVTGQVTVSLLIGARGEVVDVKVLEAEPAGVFEDAALTAVRQWRFQPATYKGEPVRVWVRQTLRFKLS